MSTIIRILFIALLTVGLLGCSPANIKEPLIPSREYSIQSVLWQQHAAEYRALAYQTYRLARLRLNQILSAEEKRIIRPAVLTDIDETVLDNSPFNGKLIALDSAYSKNLWLEWGEMADADTIPGALEFFKYAAEKGVEIFYISNRYAEQKSATIKNLKKFGFPYTDESHILLREKSSGKESRRQSVAETHEIVLLLGDNLSDFSGVFDRQNTEKRNALVDSLNQMFGDRFIIFPNPMYGDWESQGIYQGRNDWTPAQLDSLRRQKIQSF